MSRSFTIDSTVVSQSLSVKRNTSVTSRQHTIRQASIHSLWPILDPSGHLPFFQCQARTESQSRSTRPRRACSCPCMRVSRSTHRDLWNSVADIFLHSAILLNGASTRMRTATTASSARIGVNPLNVLAETRATDLSRSRASLLLTTDVVSELLGSALPVEGSDLAQVQSTERVHKIRGWVPCSTAPLQCQVDGGSAIRER